MAASQSRIASIEGSIGAYAQSPDGKRLAFVGTLHGEPERSYSQPDLWVVDLPGGTPRNLTASYDFDVNGSVGGDQRSPRGQLPAEPVWTPDGRSIIVKVGEQGNANLVRVDAASGQMTPLTKGSQEIIGLHRGRRRDAARRCPVHCDGHRRSRSRPDCDRRLSQEADDVQRRALRSTQHAGAGGDSGTRASTGRRFKAGFSSRRGSRRRRNTR